MPAADTKASLLPARAVDLPFESNTLPIALKGIKFYPAQPGRMDFILEGDVADTDQKIFRQEARRVIGYFLTSLTLPQDDIWVNLSPFEHERMIPLALGKTEMGRDLLVADYALKQLASVMLHPDKDLGQRFWHRVYQQAREKYGTADIPVSSFNKVWIVPDKAVVYPGEQGVLVVNSRLKVMTDKDYLATSKQAPLLVDQHQKADQLRADDLSLEVLKDLIIPEIEREINEADAFVRLRQMYQAMILAVWYKKHLKEGVLGQVFVDRNKTAGSALKDERIKEAVYHQYVKAFKKGVFNFIREEYDPVSDQRIARKYFSGGLQGVRVDQLQERSSLGDLEPFERSSLPSDKALIVKIDLLGVASEMSLADSAMSVDESQENTSNPYGKDDVQNVCRSCAVELDPAYGILELLDSRKDQEQRMLLIGVGRGVSAMEMALRYPKLKVTAINKEKDLWNDEINRRLLHSYGYSDEAIAEARGRVEVIAVDVLDVSKRNELIGAEKFDLVFFEPRVQVYFEDKLGPIEDFFNRYVKVGGEYGFVTNGIFTSTQAFEDSDFGSPIFERNPDAKAVALISRAFKETASISRWHKLGGNLYIRFKRFKEGDVHIPLRKLRNEEFTTPLGLELKWSIYEMEGADIIPDQTDLAMTAGVGIRANQVYSYLDQLLFSAHPALTNPILILGGDPGAGKSTLAEEYKKRLLERGQRAVLINTDLLFKTDGLLFKQTFLRKWLRIPVLTPKEKMQTIERLLVDRSRVNDLVRQLKDIWSLSDKKGVVKVQGVPDIQIDPETVILIEGSLAHVMMADALPVTKKVFLSIDPALQRQRIIERSVKVKGHDQKRAELNADILTDEVFAPAFTQGIDGYNAMIYADAQGRLRLLNHDSVDKDIKAGRIKVRGLEWETIDIGKYGFREVESREGYVAYVGKIISLALIEAMRHGYFKRPGLPRIYIGFSSNKNAQKISERLTQVIAAHGIPVTLANEASIAYVAAHATNLRQPSHARYDVAFHVQPSGRYFDIKIYQKGVSSYMAFDGFIEQADLMDHDEYHSYASLEDIPIYLLKREDLKTRLKNSLAVFDIEALKKSVPEHLDAGDGLKLSIDREGIRRQLDDLGLEDQRIGGLKFEINDEGAVHKIYDADGTSIGAAELALIFVYYLHSIGEKGGLVGTMWSPSYLERLARMMGISYTAIQAGVQKMIGYERELVAINSTGHIHFNYKGELFASSTPAIKLLILEIMIKNKMTLKAYLDLIYAKVGRTKNLQETLDEQSRLKNGDIVMPIGFNALYRVLSSYDPYDIAENIAIRLSFTPGYDVIVSVEAKQKEMIKLRLSKGGDENIFITMRFSTSEKDKLRLYVETPGSTDPKKVSEAVKRELSVLSVHGIGKPKDEAMVSYGGISFRSDMFAIEQTAKMPGSLAGNIQRTSVFGRIKGIVPIIISIEKYTAPAVY